MCKLDTGAIMQTLLENIFRSFEKKLKPGTWIDEIEKNTHINSSPNIFLFKRYNINKIIVQRRKRTK
jgi:hypothetical protein